MNWIKIWDELPPVGQEVWVFDEHTKEIRKETHVVGVDGKSYWHPWTALNSAGTLAPTDWCLIDTPAPSASTLPDELELCAAVDNLQSICRAQGKLINEFEGLVERSDRALVQLEKLTDELVRKRGKRSC